MSSVLTAEKGRTRSRSGVRAFSFWKKAWVNPTSGHMTAPNCVPGVHQHVLTCGNTHRHWLAVCSTVLKRCDFNVRFSTRMIKNVSAMLHWFHRWWVQRKDGNRGTVTNRWRFGLQHVWEDKKPIGGYLPCLQFFCYHNEQLHWV